MHIYMASFILNTLSCKEICIACACSLVYMVSFGISSSTTMQHRLFYLLELIDLFICYEFNYVNSLAFPCPWTNQSSTLHIPFNQCLSLMYWFIYCNIFFCYWVDNSFVIHVELVWNIAVTIHKYFHLYIITHSQIPMNTNNITLMHLCEY